MFETKLFPWDVDPRSGGCLGSKDKELDRLEYEFPALTGLFKDPLDNPLPIGDERGVPYVSIREIKHFLLNFVVYNYLRLNYHF